MNLERLPTVLRRPLTYDSKVIAAHPPPHRRPGRPHDGTALGFSGLATPGESPGEVAPSRKRGSGGGTVCRHRAPRETHKRPLRPLDGAGGRGSAQRGHPAVGSRAGDQDFGGV